MRKPLTCEEFFTRYGTPPGYQRLTWALAQIGQLVLVFGTHNNKPIAYGPFTITNLTDRRLTNRRGRSFLEPGEFLLVPDQATVEARQRYSEVIGDWLHEGWTHEECAMHVLGRATGRCPEPSEVGTFLKLLS